MQHSHITSSFTDSVKTDNLMGVGERKKAPFEPETRRAGAVKRMCWNMIYMRRNFESKTYLIRFTFADRLGVLAVYMEAELKPTGPGRDYVFLGRVTRIQ